MSFGHTYLVLNLHWAHMPFCLFCRVGRLTCCFCTTIHRYPIFSTRYSVMCKVYTGYCGTSEIEHGLCACTVDNPLAKARGLSLRTGAQTMLYLSHILNGCWDTRTTHANRELNYLRKNYRFEKITFPLYEFQVASHFTLYAMLLSNDE